MSKMACEIGIPVTHIRATEESRGLQVTFGISSPLWYNFNKYINRVYQCLKNHY